MIKFDNVSFSYPGGEKALRGVCFEALEGRILCLAGPNGSGKSTILSLAAGILTPDSGKITVDGNESPGREKAIRARTGLVLQEADLQILGSTVQEDLLLGLEDEPGIEKRAGLLAHGFGLAHCLEEPVQTLSYGQKRKLTLAAQILRRPGVLLLDEPFSGLDYPGAREMRAILMANKEQGLTQVVASHDLEPLADIMDGMAVVSRGRVELAGRPSEIMDRVREYGVRPPCSWMLGRELRGWDIPDPDSRSEES